MTTLSRSYWRNGALPRLFFGTGDMFSFHRHSGRPYVLSPQTNRLRIAIRSPLRRLDFLSAVFYNLNYFQSIAKPGNFITFVGTRQQVLGSTKFTTQNLSFHHPLLQQ